MPDHHPIHDNTPERTAPGGPQVSPLEIAVDGRGVEPALRAFKRLVLRDGILKEVKQRRYYEKPGERRRRKIREAERRRRRQLARERRDTEGPRW